MTITLKVDDKVREALKQAFPTSDVDKRIDKYLSELERLIFKALQYGQTPEQRKLNLYSISTHQLQNCGAWVKQIRLHKWLADNGLALVEPVIRGSKISGKISECKLTSLVTLHHALTMPTGDALEKMTDREIDLLLDESQGEKDKLISLIYPELEHLETLAEIKEHYHIVDVDLESLKNYIVWVTTEAKHYNATKKATAVRQARIIFAIAQHLGGKFLQCIKPSPFGRTYYEGISVQSVNKDLRRGMLGNSWSYDIRSSVIAWKMGFAREFMAAHDPNADVRRVFSATIGYLEDKQDFVTTLRCYTFKSDSNCEPEFQKKLIKQVLTAISFGARMRTCGWLDKSGQFHNPAIVDIIKNANERDRLFNCILMRSFIHEQNLLDDFIFSLVQQQRPDLLKMDCLQTNCGRPSKTKVLAYLYQHAETEVMDIVRRIAREHGKKVMAHIHDAVVVRTRLGSDLKHEIELEMREQTGNPYWRLAAEELKRFESRCKDIRADEEAHRQRIKQEEEMAQRRSQSKADS